MSSPSGSRVAAGIQDAAGLGRIAVGRENEAEALRTDVEALDRFEGALVRLREEIIVYGKYVDAIGSSLGVTTSTRTPRR